MRIHYLQHVPFEGLGHIETWIGKTGCQLSCTRVYEGESLPDTGEFDWLIILGGPMSVHDAHLYPWLRHEKILIKAAIDEGKSVLGICLGAQLIADVLGASVYPAEQKEIGWFPVYKTRHSILGVFGMFPDTFDAFHWHGETFDLPHEAVHLFKSGGCENQGFVFRKKVIGFQFHMESTPESVKDLVDNCSGELAAAPSIQPAQKMTADPGKFAAVNKIMDNVLNYMLSIT